MLPKVGATRLSRSLSTDVLQTSAMCDLHLDIPTLPSELGLTQEALSEASGISKPYLSQIEGGKRDGSTKVLSAISKALDVPVGLLID